MGSRSLQGKHKFDLRIPHSITKLSSYDYRFQISSPAVIYYNSPESLLFGPDQRGLTTCDRKRTFPPNQRYSFLGYRWVTLSYERGAGTSSMHVASEEEITNNAESRKKIETSYLWI